MSRIDITNTIVKVTEKIKRGEVASIDDTFLESIADLDHYVEQAVMAKLRADNNAVVRNIQDAQMSTNVASLQLNLPGLEHAALPAAVKDLGAPASKPTMKPLRMATAKEIRSEIKTYRRRVEVQARVVGGYEETWRKVEEMIDLDDETTGAEIESTLKAITAS
jgi:hypothetical protein